VVEEALGALHLIVAESEENKVIESTNPYRETDRATELTNSETLNPRLST